MARRPLFNAGLLALLACGLQASSAVVTAQWPAAGTERVTVALFPEAVIDDSMVTLGQIAKLSGGPDTLRKWLGKLDVAEFKLGVAHGMVLCEQVRFRLLLSGLEEGHFQLSGAKRTVILESEEPATFRKIVSAAEQALRAKHPGAGSLTAIRGVNVPVVALRTGERVRFDAKVKDQDAGRAVVNVALMVNGKTREVVPVQFEITETEPALKAAAPARPGISTALYTTPARDSRPALVKSNDSVRIFANIGAARLEALGEALQDGRVGEVIRVRNVESNRVVHGRVQANGMVLVDY
ncbi:MAG TPA: flagellar basal body P-ring formation chaperone FlgA [Gemmataceae bacterium]|jgi:hypothetical protein|nr:flagellar basal body P-ring formation chaperone FlgA [Gemmataceae bacterium]